MAETIYENILRYTFDALQREALNSVNDDIDKREGSVLFDATAPCAYIVSQCMNVLYQVAMQSRIQTANGEYLDLCCSQSKIYRNEATKARWIIRVTPASQNIQNGTRFISTNGLNLIYEIMSEAETQGEYIARCEIAGVEAGRDFGELEEYPIEHELQRVEFVRCIDGGRDRETDAELRLRWYATAKSQGYGGNFDDYKTWVLSKFAQDGGYNFDSCYIFPAWDGGGTVKIVPTIADEANGACSIPDEAAINALKAWLDPEDETGKGAGLAPVGHKVTCEAPHGYQYVLLILVTMKAEQHLTNNEIEAIKTGVKDYFAQQRLECGITLGSSYKSEYRGIIAPSIITSIVASKSSGIEAVTIINHATPFTENDEFVQTADHIFLPFIADITVQEEA